MRKVPTELSRAVPCSCLPQVKVFPKRIYEKNTAWITPRRKEAAKKEKEEKAADRSSCGPESLSINVPRSPC